MRASQLIPQIPEVNGQVNPPVVIPSRGSNTKSLGSTPRNFTIRPLDASSLVSPYEQNDILLMSNAKLTPFLHPLTIISESHCGVH